MLSCSITSWLLSSDADSPHGHHTMFATLVLLKTEFLPKVSFATTIKLAALYRPSFVNPGLRRPENVNGFVLSIVVNRIFAVDFVSLPSFGSMKRSVPSGAMKRIIVSVWLTCLSAPLIIFVKWIPPSFTSQS